jgi:hypothetical protein
MMFTIDLLKGAGLPKKSRPVVVAMAMIPLLIPLMGTVVLAACWQHNRTLMQTQQKIINDNQIKINASADDLACYTRANAKILTLRQQLEDVDMGLQYRVQISDILRALTESLPDNLVLTRLDMNRMDQQKKETDKATGNVRQTLVIQRKLRVEVGGVLQDQTDVSADEYIQKLRSCENLKGLVESIQIVARNNGSLDGQNCAFYEIECLLKEQN